ncbi:conserved hypothetical protein [Methanosalsum zhilinae DSM 4017]|uniref:DUF420 domain-containing protein n=1 Tax=Methanosalsum zhilinae (strain DSM 4017 / NBRC 107636 / OCM 62 / WeN5) TaxID=679901 RepID=F7XPF4_METZD|nr:hypothetical protein [Methanosalsum zhilinae]AEH60283.1 conserved hypothetical protein [Methanosalsum zhilinae DSM 4017]
MTIPESIMLADVSLILQILALIILVYSILKFKRSNRKKEDIDTHGKIASIAFALVLITVVYMAYSAYNLFQLWISVGVSLTTPIVMLVSLHGLLGVITLIFAALFVANRWKWKKVGYMRSIAATWTITFLGGIIIYSYMYL